MIKQAVGWVMTQHHVQFNGFVGFTTQSTG